MAGALFLWKDCQLLLRRQRAVVLLAREWNERQLFGQDMIKSGGQLEVPVFWIKSVNVREGVDEQFFCQSEITNEIRVLERRLSLQVYAQAEVFRCESWSDSDEEADEISSMAEAAVSEVVGLKPCASKASMQAVVRGETVQSGRQGKSLLPDVL